MAERRNTKLEADQVELVFRSLFREGVLGGGGGKKATHWKPFTNTTSPSLQKKQRSAETPTPSDKVFPIRSRHVV